MRHFLLILVGIFAVTTARADGSAVDQTAAGRKLYVNKCAKCHKMYDPANYTDRQWDSWMGKMQKKAKLNPQEKEAVNEYVRQTLLGKKREGVAENTR